MSKKLLPTSTLALAGALSLGVIGLTGAASVADDGDAYVKREDQSTELIAVSDDDEDDDETGDEATGTNSGTGTAAGDGTAGTNTQQAGQTGTNTATNTGSDDSTSDLTNSKFTAVSRDGEPSRGDKTKDRTMDGGDPTRDLTPNLTNDSSRNDTRG